MSVSQNRGCHFLFNPPQQGITLGIGSLFCVERAFLRARGVFCFLLEGPLYTIHCIDNTCIYIYICRNI